MAFKFACHTLKFERGAHHLRIDRISNLRNPFGDGTIRNVEGLLVPQSSAFVIASLFRHKNNKERPCPPRQGGSAWSKNNAFVLVFLFCNKNNKEKRYPARQDKEEYEL